MPRRKSPSHPNDAPGFVRVATTGSVAGVPTPVIEIHLPNGIRIVAGEVDPAVLAAVALQVLGDEPC